MGKSKARGNAWERQVEMECGTLRRAGLAKVAQIPDRVRVRKFNQKNGEITGSMLKASDVDFIGLLKGGRAVAFDAKRTKTISRFDFSLLGPEQVLSMRETVELGGVAFVYLSVDAGQHKGEYVPARRYVIPVTASGLVGGRDYFDKKGRRSIPFDELEPYRSLTNWHQNVIELISDGAWELTPEPEPELEAGETWPPCCVGVAGGGTCGCSGPFTAG
jgi:penicillin-binding protein-related factor A (putative recombinase)